MAERRENSVLFSLKELRGIEDGRVKREKEEAQARVDADRATREAAERSAREAEERKRRDEEERLRRIEEEKENRSREDQVRLQEAERRHRVEGELRIQEERMRLEANARVVHKSPVKAIASITAVLVVIAGGLGYKMYQDHQAELAAQKAALADAQEAAKREKAEIEAKNTALLKEMERKLAGAQSAEERTRIKLEYERDKAAALRDSQNKRHTTTKSDTPTPGAPVKNVKKHDVSDNPLEGL